MKTSRIIRAGKRNNIIPIADESQDHVLVYVYNTQSNTTRKRHGFSVGIEIDLVVVWVVEIDVVSVWGSELTRFQCRDYD